MLDSRMLPPFNWKDNMQKIIVGHKDVKILARSSSGNVVDCLTSSILLSAYSSTLRKSFDSEEDNYVLFCQDFSEDCVRSVLEFLTFGNYIDNMGHQLTSEVVSFLTALNIKGFHVDGGFKCKTESSFPAGSSAKVKLSVVNGVGLQVSPLDIKSEEKELKNLPEYPEPIGYEPDHYDGYGDDGYVPAYVEANFSESDDEYVPLSKKRKSHKQTTKVKEEKPSDAKPTQKSSHPKKKKKKLKADGSKQGNCLPCTLCDKQLGSEALLDAHLSSAHIQQKLKADKEVTEALDSVRPMFMSEWFLNQSIQENSSNSKKQKVCEFCGKFCDSVEDKAKHLVQHFSPVKSEQRKCELCPDEVFNNEAIYQKHMRLHQNVCYLCGEAMGRGIKGYVTHLMMHIEKILNPDMPYQPPPNAKCHKDQLPIDPNSKSRDLLCPHCEVHFSCAKSFFNHLKVHVVECVNDIKFCQLCHAQFPTLQEYVRHLPLHAKEFKFTCPNCDAVPFISDRMLQLHIKDCYRKEVLQCDLCGFTTDKHVRFKEHKYMHRGSYGTRKCKQCKVVCKNDTELRAHMEKEHEGILPYMCESCPMGFLSESRLLRHRTQKHENLANFRCGICNELFKIRHNITKHMNCHMESPAFRCTVCLAEFRCQATGYIHIRKTHDGNGSLKKEIPKEVKQQMEKYIIKIIPEKLAEAPRRQTRPLEKALFDTESLG